MSAQFNTIVLMSGVDYFDDGQAINPFMDKNVKINIEKARAEHQEIRQALQSAGVEVKVVPPPKDCQDGVYTANWALVRGGKAVLSNLPNARQGEEPYAEKVLKDLGKTTYKIPGGVHFSGQGDAVADGLGYSVINLQTIPKKTWYGKAVINHDSGWPDSYFYDIDLALAVLRQPSANQKGLIAWCPDAFMPQSRKRITAFDGVDKIEVDFNEAKKGFATNLVSTGETVVMSANAPKFKTQLEKLGFKVITPQITELAKGGGYIRCTTLTLNNI
jgi:N-dimethylarginine dimethylaminohydrolase